MRIKKTLLVLVAVALALTCILPVSTAFAGVNRTVVGNLLTKGTGWTIKEEDNISWETGSEAVFFHRTDEDTTVKDATVIATQNFAKNPAPGTKYYAELSSDLKISNFADGAYFAFAFGLDSKSKDSRLGKASYLEIYFSKSATTGKIDAGLRYIVDGVAKANLATETEIATIGEEFSVKMEIPSSEAKLTLTIGKNNKIFDAVALSGYPEGRFGFGQNGYTSTSVASLLVYSYSNETPRTIEDYVETFDATDPNHTDHQPGYNSNVWRTACEQGALSPSYLEVKTGDDGNSYLRFNNTGYAYAVSQYKYSNFSLEFDMFDFGRTYKTDDNGNLINSKCSMLYFGVGGSEKYNLSVSSSGCQAGFYLGWVNGNQAPQLLMRDGGYHYLGNELGHNNYFLSDIPARSREYSNVYDPNYDKDTYKPSCNPFTTDGDFVVREAITDGVWTLQIIEKSVFNEIGKDWSKVCPAGRYDLGRTPNGFIVFSAQGSSAAPESGKFEDYSTGNLSIDNLTIKNTDIGKLTVSAKDVGYYKIVKPAREDVVYNYEDFYDDNDLLSKKMEKGGCSSSIAASSAIIASLLAGGAFIAVKRRTK